MALHSKPCQVRDQRRCHQKKYECPNQVVLHVNSREDRQRADGSICHLLPKDRIFVWIPFSKRKHIATWTNLGIA